LVYINFFNSYRERAGNITFEPKTKQAKYGTHSPEWTFTNCHALLSERRKGEKNSGLTGGVTKLAKIYGRFHLGAHFRESQLRISMKHFIGSSLYFTSLPYMTR
jgi:hypothetical protein